jgi:predicted transporter
MQAFMTSLYNLVSTWQPLVWILVAIILVVNGVMIIVGGEAKDKAKKALPWVAIGCGIALGATVLAREVAGAFAF